jgi:hypothetical protein
LVAPFTAVGAWPQETQDAVVVTRLCSQMDFGIARDRLAHSRLSASICGSNSSSVAFREFRGYTPARRGLNHLTHEMTRNEGMRNGGVQRTRGGDGRKSGVVGKPRHSVYGLPLCVLCLVLRPTLFFATEGTKATKETTPLRGNSRAFRALSHLALGSDRN